MHQEHISGRHQVENETEFAFAVTRYRFTPDERDRVEWKARRFGQRISCTMALLATLAVTIGLSVSLMVGFNAYLALVCWLLILVLAVRAIGAMRCITFDFEDGVLRAPPFTPMQFDDMTAIRLERWLSSEPEDFEYAEMVVSSKDRRWKFGLYYPDFGSLERFLKDLGEAIEAEPEIVSHVAPASE